MTRRGRARGRLVADVGDAAGAGFFTRSAIFWAEVVRVHLVRQFRHHQALAVLDLFDLDDRAHGDGAAAGAVRLLDALAADDERAGSESGPSTRSSSASRSSSCEASGFSRYLLGAGAAGGVGTSERDATATRAAGGAGRQDGRRRRSAVSRRSPRRCHLQRRRLHSVYRMGGRARRAEVAVGVHAAACASTRTARGARARRRSRSRRAGGVAHDVADDTGALVVAALGAVAAVVHGVQHTAVDGLEAVADVRKRTRDDDGHRVVEQRALTSVSSPTGSTRMAKASPSGVVQPGRLPGYGLGPSWCGQLRRTQMSRKRTVLGVALDERGGPRRPHP
ncbi:hypothetical protein SPURM210S_06056 [Streptomyces purpurascens]